MDRSEMLKQATVPARKRDALLRQHREDLKIYADDRDNYELILQRMPDNSVDFDKTTCRHPYCPALDRVFAPGAYRVSIEKTTNFEESSIYSQKIPLKPRYPWGPGLKSGKYSVPKRGLGDDVLAWWCLACLEDLWLEGEGFIKFRYQYKRSEDPELWELLPNMSPETRSGGEKNSLYHLSNLQTQAVEAWRSAQEYQWEASYGAGPDPSIENPGSADLQSLDEVTGETISICLDHMEERTLSEILTIVDGKIKHERDLSREANLSAPDATLKIVEPQASQSAATALEISTPPASAEGIVSPVQTDLPLVTKKRSADDAVERQGSGSCMYTTADEDDAPRSGKKSRVDVEHPKNTRPVQSSGGNPAAKRAQRLRLNPPKKPSSSHDPSVAVSSGSEREGCVQNSGDDTRDSLNNTKGPKRKPRLRLTFKAGQTSTSEALRAPVDDQGDQNDE